MSATLTTMNAALKRVHHSNSISEQLYQGNPFLEMLEKQTQYKNGEVHRVTVHTGRNGGTTFLPDGGGTLNTAGEQTLNKADYKYKHIHQQIAIQEDVIEATRGDANAIAEVLDVEVSGAVNDLRKQITRTLFGNGDALICGVRTANSATINLELLDGYNAVQRGWLFPGLPVDVGTTAAEDSIIDGETILSVGATAADPEITVTSTANVTAGTHFVSIKNARDGTTSYEPNGLRNLASTSAAFGGLAASNVWGAANVDMTAQPLTLSLMLQQRQAIAQNSGGQGDFILMGLKQERKFYELLQQQIQYSGDGALSVSGDSPKWSGQTVFVHPDCPNEDIYFGVKKHIFHLASRKPFWQNAISGGNILDWVQGTSAYGGKLAYHFDLATDRRNVFARLGGLT